MQWPAPSAGTLDTASKLNMANINKGRFILSAAPAYSINITAPIV